MTRKDTAEQAFAAVESELREISHWMYHHPELAYAEHQSSSRISRFLGEHGMSVTYPAHGLDTAFEATAGTSGPRVVICCEYDALPGVGHACGHNIIATAAAGAGAALAGQAGELEIRITVLGTPAEEAGGGKIDLINAGAFEDVAAAMMIHPEGNDDVIDGRALAIQAFVVEFHGKASHASGAPQLGVNALDAFVQSYNNVSTLRQHLLPTDRVHGMITHGGEAANVIPAYTRSEWMVRAPSGERLTELIAKVTSCFEAAAMATGSRVEITPDGHPYVDLITNPVMAGLYSANSTALGRPMLTWDELEDQQAGSTDMGNVSHVVPSIHPSLVVEANGAVNHQPEFAAATITPSGDLAIRDGALGMAWTVIDLAEKDLWDQL
ncbi:MAG: M20 family metallopeptidase [Acidimicrobiia bacterium]